MNYRVQHMFWPTFKVFKTRKAGKKYTTKPVNIWSQPNSTPTGPSLAELASFFDLLYFLKVLDQNEYLVTHLKDPIHICLESEAQVHGMTFKVLYGTSNWGKRLYIELCSRLLECVNFLIWKEHIQADMLGYLSNNASQLDFWSGTPRFYTSTFSFCEDFSE